MPAGSLLWSGTSEGRLGPPQEAMQVVFDIIVFFTTNPLFKIIYEHLPSRPVVIRELGGKGKGLVATRSLKPGELVLVELPLLVGSITPGQGSSGESSGLKVRSLIQSFNRLGPEQQALVMALHAPEATKNSVNRPGLGEEEKKLLRIFRSNNIEVDKDRCGL